ncbi:hypothetical protein K1719_022783 [Acacia pycnantha]|nr:hypothetical protein K1719_022783 [Acacia pycnantha]
MLCCILPQFQGRILNPCTIEIRGLWRFIHQNGAMLSISGDNTVVYVYSDWREFGMECRKVALLDLFGL